mmetsp:Transcript_14121/g.31826  ORF Transcript_14121/g.31826 Transcript_14121/m.31826 type:complete len:433 (+) Transcript_14121:66-1364(+)
MATAEVDDADQVEDEGEENVPEQFECSICMKLLVEPVTVACGHTFCRSCLEQSLGYRSVCAVCRAPITSGQGVNVLIKSLIATQYPRALRQRLEEQDEEMQRAEQEADDARRRDVQSAQGEEGNGVILPVLLVPTSSMPSPPPLPHCKVVHDIVGEDVRALVQFALEGGRRLGIVEAVSGFDENARPVGVCLDINNVVRGLPDQPWSMQLSGRYRFRLLEPTQTHENGFRLGRCEAFFDEPTPVSQLMSTHEGDDADGADETLPELVQSTLSLLEQQMSLVGADGRRAFQQRHGDIPGATGTGAGTQVAGTSASMERLSFWSHRSILCSKDEQKRSLETTDTRARLRYCRDRLQAAGRRPILDLPGATSFMNPGQSALGSLALLVAILAILLAKAMGFLDAVASYGTGRRGSNYAQNVAAVHDAAVFFQMFR